MKKSLPTLHAQITKMQDTFEEAVDANHAGAASAGFGVTRGNGSRVSSSEMAKRQIAEEQERQKINDLTFQVNMIRNELKLLKQFLKTC